MGLDQFMDLDVDEESSTSSQQTTSKNETDLTKYDSWTKDTEDNPEKRGPYGYPSCEEYRDTIKGELLTHGELFKYHLPIFPHIEIENKYLRGHRYNLDTDHTTVTCVSLTVKELYRINREVIMLDVGHTEKDQCISKLNSRFDIDIEPTTEVHLYFFAKMRHIVKMAMGDEFVDEWGLKQKDRLLKAVYGETWTQDFREKQSGEKDLKHIDEMEEW